MKHLIIIGTGALARELYWTAKDSFGYGKEWDIKGFIDGDIKVDESEYKKLLCPVMGDIFTYQIQPNDVFTWGIGSPKARKKVSEVILNKGGEFINIIHKTAIVQGNTSLGHGVILSSFTHVNDGSIIADHVFVNSYSGFGHDVIIGAYSCLMGYVDICGFAQIGEASYFGSGSRVLPHVKIGNHATIGAGSVVLRKVKDEDTVFGNPAVSIKNAY